MTVYNLLSQGSDWPQAGSTELYQVCVASHLAGHANFGQEFVTCLCGYTSEGLPITTIVVTVGTGTELLDMLQDLHAAGAAILSLQWLRHPGQIC